MQGRAASLRPAVLSTWLLGALACAVGPNYVPVEPEVPDSWQQELTRGLSAGQASLQTWWTVFEDPQLTALVERAVESNLDLRLAVQRIDESRGQRGIARGEWFPSVFNFGSYSRNQFSQAGFALPGSGDGFNAYQFGFDTTWEIDIFGRIRRQVESANASLEASVEDYRDVLVVLLADVASTYTELRTAQLQLEFARSNLELQRGTLQLTRDRNAAGLAPDLDVRQAELNLAETESSVPLFERNVQLSIHRLGVLLGTSPGALRAELAPQGPIPRPPEQVLVGLPIDLVRQRPDVRAAERAVAAQNAQIGVATADLFPRFALIGSFAFDALDAARLFTGDATAFSFGPAMRWNLFDGGRVRANIGVQDSLTEQALTLYENTVLLALEEAENAMVAYAREIERRDALERAVLAAAQATDLVKTLYRTGLTDFQNVLDTERSLTRQQDLLAQSRGDVTLNLIRIYRALGGGWSP